MKKTFRLIPMLLMAFVAILAVSCSDDKDEPITTEQLPEQARTFINAYYPSATIVNSHKDKDEYEVIMSDGTKIDFNKHGEWKDVDAPVGKTIPNGFYPEAIDTYVYYNYNPAGINEISKDNREYEVELTNGLDLRFARDGAFIRIDHD